MAEKKHRTKTLDVIKATQGKDELVIAGEMVTLEFPQGTALSLRGAKAFLAMAEAAGARIAEDREHSALLRDVVPGGHRSTQELEAVVDELHGTKVKVTYTTRDGQRRRKSTVLVADVDSPLDTDMAEIRWRYSNTMRQLIAQSSHWASISARAVLLMECRYAPWLYQLLALHWSRKAAFLDLDLEELRTRLGVTAPSMARWINFRNFVLEPAVAEINHLTGFTVTFEPLKRKRKVVGVRFAFSRKEGEDLAEVQAEHERPRTGRNARRAGTVERIVEAERAERQAIAEELQGLAPPKGREESNQTDLESIA